MARHGCQKEMGERHERSSATVGWVARAVERLCHGLHPARLGALCAMGHRYGAVLGRAHPHANFDSAWLGVALARAGALCRVWRLGPRRGGTDDKAVDRTGMASTLGLLPPRRL